MPQSLTQVIIRSFSARPNYTLKYGEENGKNIDKSNEGTGEVSIADGEQDTQKGQTDRTETGKEGITKKENKGDLKDDVIFSKGTIKVDGVDRSTTNSQGNPIHTTEQGVRNFYYRGGVFVVIFAEN